MIGRMCALKGLNLLKLNGLLKALLEQDEVFLLLLQLSLSLVELLGEDLVIVYTIYDWTLSTRIRRMNGPRVKAYMA
ncbi:hypothetical protein Pyn_10227 [Prunus yedoensis var. nudiflora]|uniref:Uncharacterized protein n=1 Tax=Prunus yedoensis var. nudiflora TaxID=2094558 RepID=A0A314UT98_PRUYE|nr:hypothetical protein Pyn_10227 [Prunus yedoensis var. nudiflora]